MTFKDQLDRFAEAGVTKLAHIVLLLALAERGEMCAKECAEVLGFTSAGASTDDEPTNVVYSAEPEEEKTPRNELVLVGWQDSMFVPNNPRSVLATDGEDHFIACHHQDKWWNVHTDEEIDSVITAWMELPEPPEA